jgi:CRP-like cAMP-binding protein
VAQADCPAREINLVRNARDSRTLASGEVLFRDGDHGDTMFAVTEGRIALARDGTVLEDVDPAGSSARRP